MGEKSTLTYEISQGIFKELWKLSLSKKNAEYFKKDFEAATLEAHGSVFVVNAIKKSCDERFQKILLTIGLDAIGNGFSYIGLIDRGTPDEPPLAVLLSLAALGASIVFGIRALKLNQYIKAGKEYLAENNQEALQEVLDHEEETSLKARGKKMFKRRNI